MRIALGVQYNGCQYHGWQIQPKLNTVQAQLEHALSNVAAEKIRVFCAGRTDTGVHASGQVVHFETQVKRDMRAWVFGSNTHLAKDIAVHWAQEVPEDFHARFSAEARRYRYFIYNHVSRPAALSEQMSWYYMHLDPGKMAAACEHLVGEHDFSAYRSVGCQAKSPIRNIHSIEVTQHEHVIILDIKANAFLHHMVRNIVGVLFAVGSGKADVSWTKEVLESRDRRLGGVTAPPYGLYLSQVYYPKKYKIPNATQPLLIL